MMKFKEGDKVEVLSKKDFAWQCGWMVSGNGQFYNVRFYNLQMEDRAITKVSKKDVRPSPPLLESKMKLLVGDTVEVFNVGLWKVATILRIIGRRHYAVKFFGSGKELEVPKPLIRIRLKWQEDKWFVIGKGYGNGEVEEHVVSSGMLPAQSRISMPAIVESETFPSTAGCEESLIISRRRKKRTLPSHFSGTEKYADKSFKRSAFEDEFGRPCVRYPYPMTEKMNGVTNLRNHLGGKYMHAPSNKPKNKHCGIGRGKPDVVSRLQEKYRGSDDFDDDICSIGSCSVVNYGPSGDVQATAEDAKLLFSDAISNEYEDEEEGKFVPPRDIDGPEMIHRLELHAYWRTLQALYASGPISWEQEALLTNLRLSLHISNDEHLAELKNLISSKRSPHIN